jgi:hypothetical protein
VGSGVGDGVGDGITTVGEATIDGAATGVDLTCATPCVHAPSNVSAVRLSAKRWNMEIRPERGGRITSLRLDGEELLDQGIGVDQPTAKGFVEGGAFGWDEMVPNLEATDTLPDHGEAWRLPWDVLRKAPIELSMRCRGRLVPWELVRSTYLRDDSVDFVYTYRNVGKTPHNAYWCAHPLFKFEAGMDVGADVPRDLPEGRSTKVFLPRGSIGRVALGWPSGARIEMSWDPSVTPDVAIWMCNGDLGGYRQVAIEPATASPMLDPGSTLRWWLRIRAL